MKSILHLKFIVLYIIFGFLCVFSRNAALTNELIMEILERRYFPVSLQGGNSESPIIPLLPLPYFSEDSSIWAVQSQLIAMRLYLNSSLCRSSPPHWIRKSHYSLPISRGTHTAPRTPFKILIRPKSGTASTYTRGTRYHDYFDQRILLLSWHRSPKDSQQSGYLLIPHHPRSRHPKSSVRF